MHWSDENAIRASWAAEVKGETASRRPLLELSPHRRPYESGPSAGMSSSAARVTSHKHYKLTLSRSHVHLACIFILAFNQPPNQLSWFQPPPIVSISPSEVSGCLCTLRCKGKILISSCKVAWCVTPLFFCRFDKKLVVFLPLIFILSVWQFLHLQLLQWRMIGLYSGRSVLRFSLL